MSFYQPPAMATIVDVTSSTLAPTVANSGTTYVLDRAAGITVTLPSIDAGEVGTKFKFVNKTTVTSNDHIIQVPSADETMTGVCFTVSDGSAAVLGYKTGATTDTITLDGSTTGGIAGDMIEVEALSTTLWAVKVLTSSTGTEATPFSAAVS